MPANIRIDLVSDTVSLPGSAMREAMARAEVGDEQRGEDPSINALCERVADLLGHEAAMFLPSGIMCNQVAIAVHCRPGDEIMTSENAHIIGSEGAGTAVFAGSLIRTVPSVNGIFDGETLQASLRAPRPKAPHTRLVNIEQTVNRGGGAIWPRETLQDVIRIAKSNSLAMHMDGARLLNAVVASGTSATDFAQGFDSVWLDFSKGLGCPVGGVLAGSKAFIEEAWSWKYRFGGAMRQAGILAAAGLYALDNNVERLADDHANACVFADLISKIPGVRLEFEETATNLVFFNVSATGVLADDISIKLIERGIRIGVENETRMRAVTHLDINRENVIEAAGAVGKVLQED